MTKKKQPILTSGASLTFDSLIEAVKSLNSQLELQASKAVNLALTVRNWFIGSYISEYELRGSDRARYGEELYRLLAERLEKLGVPGCRKRQLYYYVAFYRAYPQIVRTLSAQFQPRLMIPLSNKKVRSTFCKQQRIIAGDSVRGTIGKQEQSFQVFGMRLTSYVVPDFAPLKAQFTMVAYRFCSTRILYAMLLAAHLPTSIGN